MPGAILRRRLPNLTTSNCNSRAKTSVRKRQNATTTVVQRNQRNLGSLYNATNATASSQPLWPLYNRINIAPAPLLAWLPWLADFY